MNKPLNNIIISRTDSIGDVILTLPVAKILKKHFPEIKIAFLGKNYTKPVIEACEHVDQFIEVNEFMAKDVSIDGEKPQAILHVFPVAAIARRAKKLAIPLRIGTTNRLYHWLTCNKLVKLSRKNSDLHEAQLNIKLLEPLGIETNYSLDEIRTFFGFTRIKLLREDLRNFIDEDKYSIILHPKSQGSAREWGTKNFVSLIKLLDKNVFQIFISGTEKERALLDDLFIEVGNDVTDITGKMSLDEFISFIAHCDALVANSTGPLHIAAALGKTALGIYPPIRPMHPGRWKPLGRKAKYFVIDMACNDCRKNPHLCHCIKEVPPFSIAQALESNI